MNRACLWLPLLLLWGLPSARADDGACRSCHGEGLVPADPHAALGVPCAGCHGGDPKATELEAGHAGLIAGPGVPEGLDVACGGCHPQQVSGVRSGLMYSGRGIVNVTRYVLDGQTTPDGTAGFESLRDSPADSLLRKLCAGCHLGSDQAVRAAGSPGMERRGGCLGCHLERAPGGGHPLLTARVGDAHCFGCHARSGRISLSYVGLAEVDADPAADPAGLGYLDDGRLVEHRPADLHQRAGMACIDCHTGSGLMGDGNRMDLHQEAAVDIACVDCHDNRSPRLRLADWPVRHAALKARIPFAAGPEQPFLVTARRGTPLWHIELRPEGAFLHRKLQGGAIPIPRYRDTSHTQKEAHRRLTCSACHAQWAPQCYGCHTTFDPGEGQWDHIAGEQTPGAWIEKRWAVRNELPPLGVGADGRIRPAVPGMIFTIGHPDWEGTKFHRLFSLFDPHTSGPARSCGSCHAASEALGLGRGRLIHGKGAWRFHPAQPILSDGLPADAWTSLDGTLTGGATRIGNRPLNAREMRRILEAVAGMDSSSE